MRKEFTSIFPSKFLKDLDKLPKFIRDKVDERIETIVNNPTIGKHLKDSQFWSDRLGDYRILYLVDFIDKKIEFYTIDKRSKVYRR